MRLFGCLLTLLLSIVIAVIAIARNVLKSLFGLNRSESNSSRTKSNRAEQREKRESSSNKKKVFDDKEGEYVEFEEVKE